MIFALAILRLVNSFHRVAPTIAQPTGEEMMVQSCAYGTYSSSQCVSVNYDYFSPPPSFSCSGLADCVEKGKAFCDTVKECVGIMGSSVWGSPWADHTNIQYCKGRSLSSNGDWTTYMCSSIYDFRQAATDQGGTLTAGIIAGQDDWYGGTAVLYSTSEGGIIKTGSPWSNGQSISRNLDDVYLLDQNEFLTENMLYSGGGNKHSSIYLDIRDSNDVTTTVFFGIDAPHTESQPRIRLSCGGEDLMVDGSWDAFKAPLVVMVSPRPGCSSWWMGRT